MTPEEAQRLYEIKPLFDAEMREIEESEKAKQDICREALLSNPTEAAFDELRKCQVRRRERMLALLAKYCPFYDPGDPHPAADISARIDLLGDGHARLMVVSTHMPDRKSE